MAPRQRFVSTAQTASPPTRTADDAPPRKQHPPLSPSCSTVSTATGEVGGGEALISSGKDRDGRGSSSSPQTIEDLARERHDFFNLFALLLVIAPTLPHVNLQKLFMGYAPGETRMDDEAFFQIWVSTALYFLIDLIWVASEPICVKSPRMIIAHHVAAVGYLLGPMFFSDYRGFTGAVISVEINTWFLILRRVLYKRSDIVPKGVSYAVSLCFYISWICIRFFVYPAILVNFLVLAHDRVLNTGILFHWEMIVIAVHFFLCLLNMKWSYDLFYPIVHKWLYPSADDGSAVVASGL